MILLTKKKTNKLEKSLLNFILSFQMDEWIKQRTKENIVTSQYCLIFVCMCFGLIFFLYKKNIKRKKTMMQKSGLVVWYDIKLTKNEKTWSSFKEKIGKTFAKLLLLRSYPVANPKHVHDA